MRANCVLKHCLPLKTSIPNFRAFFVLLAIALSCIHTMSSLVTLNDKTGVYTSHCFIIHLLGGGHCPLARDSKPIRLLEIIPTSLSLYILRYIVNCKDQVQNSLTNVDQYCHWSNCPDILIERGVCGYKLAGGWVFCSFNWLLQYYAHIRFTSIILITDTCKSYIKSTIAFEIKILLDKYYK